MPRKTFLLIITAVTILGVVLIGGYFYFFSGLFGNLPGAGGGAPAIQEFLPFGAPSGGDSSPRGPSGPSILDGSDGSIPGEEATGQPKLRKLVQNPVAGFISFVIGSSTLVRYMEKETGNVFEIDMSLPGARTRITNTTIPRVKEALFGPKGDSVIARYIDEGGSIRTFSATIPNATSTEARRSGVELRGSFLNDGIRDAVLSPKAARLFGLTAFGGSAIGVVSDLNGSKKSQVFGSIFSDWLPTWTSDQTILLVTRPAASVFGYAYTLDSSSGSFKKIYGGALGLTALLGPDGKKLLVSEISEGLPSLKIFYLAGKNGVFAGLQTIADKCVWATATTIYCAVPGNIPRAERGYPDAWYQGLVSFSDSFWKIDSENLSTDMVSPISESAREDIDAINLFATKAGDYVFFLNKNDSSLWSLGLNL